jgi:UDP-N-acetylmuramoyl-tripeptide--D-alanyl-D-alanine ligase
VVNNIFPAHLEGLGSIEGIIAEKASIANGVKDEGRLLINGDFAGLVEYCDEAGFDYTSFGTESGCDIRVEKLVSEGFSGRVSIDGVDVFVPLGGIGNLHNAIAAWAVCREFGISASQFDEAVKTLPPLSMRMDVKEVGAVTIIDDCYNANPASMKNAVEFLMSLAGEQKKRSVFVCGDMAELGADSDRLHEELGEVIAEAKVDIVLVTGRQGERVAGAIRRLQHDADVFAFAGTEELCENIINYVRTDDIILVKGSRSGRLEAAVERIVEIFSN